ncbi:MAG: hypothetical protein CL887_01210, partial [Dehalococcoidia bacterium]|nr:hypothetical protein [Dehalococcoidia bacterium]
THSIAECLQSSKNSAYQSVSSPVEGTILTVLSDISKTAKQHSRNSNIRNLFEKITISSSASVNRTPMLLKQLRDAEVVDSGGYGLEIILIGMNLALKNEDPLLYPMTIRKPGNKGRGIQNVIETTQANRDTYGFCIQFNLNSNFDFKKIKSEFESVATSTIILGKQDIFKIHVHSDSYEKIIKVSNSLGIISNISKQNMDTQASNVLENISSEKSLHLMNKINPDSTCALIAVASGNGITSLFYELGAAIVIDGGDSMNPSVSDFLDAINALNSEVLILPNNKNIISTAKQACNLSGKISHVLETETIQQGIECTFDFDKDLTASENISALQNTTEKVSSYSIFKSSRSTKINGKEIIKDQIIGMANGEIEYVGETPDTVLMEVIGEISKLNFERIIVISGDSISPNHLTEISKNFDVRFSFEEDTLEFIHGGQPHFDYLISAI